MKVKSITIQGMHKVENTTYELSDCNYLFGKNGSGKSTVLQAIQLAILGYIPGYPKRNQDIVKHANNRIMSVKVVFDDDNYIERTYMCSKSKVSCDVDTSFDDIEGMVSEIEIPIYNFNSFLSLSPNEQKKWFLGYLPDTIDFKKDINLHELFKEQTKKLPEYDEAYIDAILQDMDGQVSSVAEVHESIKSLISFTKSQIKAKQNVLADLMFYDDIDSECDLDTIEKEIEDLRNQFEEWSNRLSNVNNIEQRKSYIRALEDNFTKDDFDEEPKVIGIRIKLEEAEDNIKEVNDQILKCDEEYEEVQTRYEKAQTELSKCIRPTDVSGTCPYLPDVDCKKLSDHKRDIASSYKAAKANFDKAEDERNEVIEKCKPLREQVNDLIIIKTSLNQELDSLKSSYDSYTDAKKDLKEYIESLDDKYDTEDTVEGIQTTLSSIRSRLDEDLDIKSKLRANEKYKEISASNVKELDENENHLVLLETLRDYTGPNNLQADLAEKPFINLSTEITKYLKKMFNNDSVECWFNLSSKSNSFEFGIKRDEMNIPFTVLSSGEQCMYMLAMQSALMKNNDSILNMILIDDAFDHLDDDNIVSLVEAVLDTDVQYIIAGVAMIPDTKELEKLNRITIGG